MNRHVLSGRVLAGLAVLALSAVPGHAATHGKASTHKSSAHKGHASKGTAQQSGDPVVMISQPGSALDKQARILNAEDLASAARHHEKPLVLIGSAPLSTTGKSIGLFVQVQSASLCGSAGCSTDVYLQQKGGWTKVLDSVSGPISLLPTTHGIMKDILVDGSDRWIWKKGTYTDTLVATDLPGFKTSIRRHQAAMKKSGHPVSE
ncbi:MAG: hypothetical protein ABF759_08235 [Acetobacter malorum]|uniref:hypothetical protein n=1 Tax=Acetobacter malorum TaxID=178901 RepID=UPI0039ED7DDF